MSVKLEVKNAVCGYGSNPIVKNISLDVETGDILCLLGPNGAGKTTLFRTVLGFLKIISGEILLNGVSIKNWSKKRMAKVLAYVPQVHSSPFPFNSLDVVVLGRTAHLGMFASPSKKDFGIAEEIMESLQISYLKEKAYTEISGGERQLVLIARAFGPTAQAADYG